MASITIRQLPETTKRKLRIRAAQHGRSMEQEAREILKSRSEPAETGRISSALSVAVLLK